MIPKTLKFRAFESYAEEQFIDFTELSENGIFLINGETGAGKTAILDAMTYALYGETSGGSRGEVRSLHSSADGISTEVEFVFELRGADYKFKRSITLRERNSKVAVSTEQDALFYDGENFIPFEPNPTKSRVSTKATELLGLTLDQFRQVIILPQGQFEKFLTSESGEKEQILSTLFNTEKFTRISEILYTEARKSVAKLNVEKEVISSLLLNEGFDSFEEISEHITEASGKNKQAKSQLEALSKHLEAEKEKLSEAEILFRLFSERELTSNENEVLNSQTEEIERLAERLKKGQDALKLTGIFSEYNTSSSELKLRNNNLLTAEKEEKALSNQSDSLKAELDKLMQNEKAAKQAEERLISLKQLIPVYTEIAESERSAKSAQAAFISVQEEVNKNHTDENALNEKIREFTASADKLLVSFVQKIPNLTVIKNELTAVQIKVKNLKHLEFETGKLSAELSEKNRQITALDLDITEQKKKVDEAYNLQLENLTDFIAKSLKDGFPCPVCGSIEHPNIHNSERVHQEQGTKQLKNELDSLQERRNELLDEKNALQSKIDSREISIADIKSDIQDSKFSDEDLTKAQSNLQLAQRAEQKLGEINLHLSKLKKELDVILIEKSRLEKSLYELQVDAAAKKSRLDSLKAALIPDIPDSTSLEREIIATDDFIKAYKDDYSRVSIANSDMAIKLSSAKTALEQTAAEAQKADEKYKVCEIKLLEALKSNGFSAVEDFTSHILSDDSVREIQQKISDFENKKYAVEKRLDDLNSKLTGKLKPDLELLRNQFNEQEDIRRKLSEELAVSLNEEKRISKIADDYKDKFSKYTNSIDAATRYREFAELLQGSRGLSFTRYVLGVMLSLITAEANRLLRDVHGGQFQLSRKTDGTEKKRKTGLDLEVQSAMAVSKFNVKNLSGGEKFLISLALSMALSSILQSQSGGISIDAMFIDEGFGSLDRQSLHEAIGILSSISGSRRTIGIISHVSELKEIIPGRIDVNKDINGSHLKVIV